MSIALDRYFTYEVEGVQSIDLEHNILRCAYYGDLEQLKAALAEAPNSINAVDQFAGRTAFMIAASLGNFSIVSHLAKHEGLDPLMKDHFGQDAFDLAWASGNSEVVRVIHGLIYPATLGDDPEPPPPRPTGP